MTTFVALLRGINVGGKHKVLMADLRGVLAEAGATEIRSYIQSGNLVFSSKARSVPALEADLEQRIAAHAGFDVPVVVRTSTQLAAVCDSNPFPTADTGALHVAFLKSAPPAGAFAALLARAAGAEDARVVGREVYLFLPDGMGRAKLPQSLALLKTPATVRNWRTVTKLLDLVDGSA